MLPQLAQPVIRGLTFDRSSTRGAVFFKTRARHKETARSSRIDDEVVQDQRQRDDNDLQDERQDQPKEEEVEPKRSKRARTEKSFRPIFVSFMVENEPTSYREAVTSLERLNEKKPLKVKYILFYKIILGSS
ncbi:hypothetical protein Tco_0972805 [Tanacetum coccineum]